MVDGDSEGGAVGVGIVCDHLWQAKAVCQRCGHGRADDARRVPDEEGHLLGGHGVRSDDDIPLVLALGVIHDDDHPSLGQGCDGQLDGFSGRLLRHAETQLPPSAGSADPMT